MSCKFGPLRQSLTCDAAHRREAEAAQEASELQELLHAQARLLVACVVETYTVVAS